MSLRAWLMAGCAVAMLGAIQWIDHKPVRHGAGVLVSAEPRQSAPGNATPVPYGDFTLTPLADFEVEARVLSRKDYTFGTESALSPTDLALGWGRMSDSAVLAQLDISQSGRFYHYRWRDAPPIPLREIIRSSANMHLIPADDTVARAIDRVKVGQVVVLRGQLVAARRPDGWRWISSLTRNDSGAGACELVLVRGVVIGDS